MSPDPTDRRAAVVRMLAASPGGLSDAALARELGDGVRPRTVNQLCRRMAAQGVLERVGARPILNRLSTSANGTGPASPPDPGSIDAKEPVSPHLSPVGAPVEPPGPAEAAPTCGPPPYDALQAWSRVVNVQALLAGWLVRRGAVLRSASVDDHGPARDLVASLDGDDVHVEVTGWPADGARTHSTTIAGDWFSAAEHAAAVRRQAHPRARIVIALPDTRRYRTLTEQRAASLAAAQTEVWFVDSAGAVHAR